MSDNNTSSSQETKENWWDKTPPVDTDNEEVLEAKPFNPDNVTEEDTTAIQKFMNIALIPHKEVAQELIYQIKEGNIDPIQTFIALKRVKAVEELCLDSQKGDKELREIILKSVSAAIDKGKNITMFGAELSTRAVSTRYDFSECGDSVLNELYAIETRVKNAIKTRETEIKAIVPADSNKLGLQTRKIVQTGMPSLTWDENEWEENINPPIKYQTEGVVCSFKKEK